MLIDVNDVNYLSGRGCCACETSEVIFFCRQIAAFKACQAIILEEYGHPADSYLAIAFLEAEGIVPSIGMEDIGQQWRSKHKPHLIGGHAFLELRYHFFRNKVALLDIDAVRGQKSEKAALFDRLHTGGRSRGGIFLCCAGGKGFLHQWIFRCTTRQAGGEKNAQHTGK